MRLKVVYKHFCVFTFITRVGLEGKWCRLCGWILDNVLKTLLLSLSRKVREKIQTKWKHTMSVVPDEHTVAVYFSNYILYLSYSSPEEAESRACLSKGLNFLLFCCVFSSSSKSEMASSLSCLAIIIIELSCINRNKLIYYCSKVWAQ